MTQAERIQAFIRANPGCSTMDIQLGMRPFIANPRARISDLRARGVIVECRSVEGVDRYFIVEPRAVVAGEQMSAFG